MTGLNMLALVFSAILSWHYLEGGSMIGCGSGSPCGQVLNSRWSTVAGVLPVSGLAMGVYLTILVASLFIGSTKEALIRRMSWSVMLILVSSAVGSAIWFIIVQEWIIGDFCIYCMTTHITGLLLAALVIWRATLEYNFQLDNKFQTNFANVQKNSKTLADRDMKIKPVVGLIMLGVFLAGILAASQIGFTSTAGFREGESQEKLPIIDYHNVPMVGSPDAPYIVTLLFDYQCSHCQQIHFMLNEAISRYNGKLAFALSPTPLNTHCNPYIPRDVDEFKNSCELAKIGLAVWIAKREEFTAFENWMFTFEFGDKWSPRSLESTRAKAVELVGQEKFDTAMTDPWIEQYMQTCIRIYGQTMQGGNGGVPKLFYNSRWVIPKLNNIDDLVMILQKSLGVPKP